MEKGLSTIVQSKAFNTLCTFVIISAYLVFLYNHLSAIKAGTISSSIIIFILMETLVILLLLLRIRPTAIIMNPVAWLYTIAGTFLPLLLLPATLTLNLFFGKALLVLGGLLAILAYLSLNRSFGLVPAIREVKTRGLYKFVRHPMYSSYFVIYIGYLLVASSLYNFVIISALFFLLYKRSEYEEEILRTDKSYLLYTEKVPYKFFPKIL